MTKSSGSTTLRARLGTVAVVFLAAMLLVVGLSGTTEAVGPGRERFGDERLRTLVAEHDSPAELVSAVAEAVAEFRVGARTDDLTLLAIQRHKSDDDSDDESSSVDDEVVSDTVRP
ncbi:MAG TPA: SpoIIE family protein phosphatase [Ilumatobacter sp.]|nr:SpoIIE family protein phosphatase [Ilumatobacter sp.]